MNEVSEEQLLEGMDRVRRWHEMLDNGQVEWKKVLRYDSKRRGKIVFCTSPEEAHLHGILGSDLW